MNTEVECLHPYCRKKVSRRAIVCHRHYCRLPEELRLPLLEINALSRSHTETLCEHISIYFADHLIGRHDILTCRGRGCDAKVVLIWNEGDQPGAGFYLPVELETVDACDRVFDKSKHKPHRLNCPAANQLHGRLRRKTAAGGLYGR